MEKVKISISGHDFYLKSEDPNRMYETAENLQKRIDKLSAMAASLLGGVWLRQAGKPRIPRAAPPRALPQESALG